MLRPLAVRLSLLERAQGARIVSLRYHAFWHLSAHAVARARAKRALYDALRVSASVLVPVPP